MDLLLTLNSESGTTLIIVTHDPTIAEQTQHVIRLRDGLLEDGICASEVKRFLKRLKV